MANETPNPTVPAATLAKLFNMTDERIRQLAKMGVVVKEAQGRYDLWASIKGYIAYLQERKVGGGTDNGEDPTIAGEKLRKMQADADMAIMERDKMAGQLIPVDEMVRDVNKMLAAFRARCMAIPTSVAPQVALAPSAQKAEELIRLAVNEALEELADYKEVPAPAAAPATGADAPAA